jgi:hypothetical protein
MSPLSVPEPYVPLQRRDDPREPEQVGHLERARRGARERRRPAWVLLQVGMAEFARTTRSGKECAVAAVRVSGYCYLYDPGPVVAEKRKRNATRAATLGNSRIVAEIRSTQLVVRKLLDLTLSNELHPLVRKPLTEVDQLLQTYTRLAELELAAG